MKKTTILRVIALLAALLMLCACQKAVPTGGEAENTSESTTVDFPRASQREYPRRGR